ncbi:MAG: PaaI family thioesterase [Actinomycetota bacterium]
MIDRQQVAALLARDPYASGLGIRLDDVKDASITIGLTVTPPMTNFHGGMHGGALFSLADCAFSLFSNQYGPAAVAIDTHMVFSAPVAVGDDLTAVVSEVSRGRRLATYRVLVHRGDGRVAGHFTGTVLTMDGP